MTNLNSLWRIRTNVDISRVALCGVIFLLSKIITVLNIIFCPCSYAVQWRSRSGTWWAARWSISSISTPEPRTCSHSFTASLFTAPTMERAKCEGTIKSLSKWLHAPLSLLFKIINLILAHAPVGTHKTWRFLYDWRKVNRCIAGNIRLHRCNMCQIFP